METIDPRILERAKKLLEEEAPPGEVWGDETPEGQTSSELHPVGDTAAASVEVISEERRQSYVERATHQLRDEGIIGPDPAAKPLTSNGSGRRFVSENRNYRAQDY